jgi:two-component system sensor histidine kinase BaeS
MVSSSSPLPPAAPPSPSRGLRWPARLDNLRTKLFMAIAGAHALLALAAFLVFSWSFDQGFVEYLNRADETRLGPLVVRLAEGYKREGHWRWVSEDRRRWFELVREVMGTPRPARRGDDGPAPASAPAPTEPASSSATGGPPMSPPGDPLLTIDPRLLLFDAEQQLLAGRQEMAQDAVMRPIQADGRVVGFLGYVPRLKTVASLEKLFSSQQNSKFAAIAAGMLVAGLVISALLSHWLARRIRRLADGADALIQGHYGVRIESQGHDELARLAQDFNHLAHTLDSAQKARQQWIADIAHELRTPLAVLRAEIEALQDGVRPLGQASLGSLAQEVAQLSRLVEDLRLLSLSDLGALSYHKEPLDLGELIEDCLASQSSALQAKGFDVRTELPAQVRVLADGARLAQVFGNLLQNTLRYTDAPARLSVRLHVANGRALVLWEDSSPGVCEADLPRLTERLFRVDGSRSRAGGGSGLGLAITQAIVQAHGGDMAAEASPLGGVAWRLGFPLSDASSSSSSTHHA